MCINVTLALHVVNVHSPTTHTMSFHLTSLPSLTEELHSTTMFGIMPLNAEDSGDLKVAFSIRTTFDMTGVPPV